MALSMTSYSHDVQKWSKIIFDHDDYHQLLLPVLKIGDLSCNVSGCLSPVCRSSVSWITWPGLSLVPFCLIYPSLLESFPTSLSFNFFLDNDFFLERLSAQVPFVQRISELAASRRRTEELFWKLSSFWIDLLVRVSFHDILSILWVRLHLKNLSLVFRYNCPKLLYHKEKWEIPGSSVFLVWRVFYSSSFQITETLSNHLFLERRTVILSPNFSVCSHFQESLSNFSSE